jgi:flagellar hook-length control protein FliK
VSTLPLGPSLAGPAATAPALLAAGPIGAPATAAGAVPGDAQPGAAFAALMAAALIGGAATQATGSIPAPAAEPTLPGAGSSQGSEGKATDPTADEETMLPDLTSYVVPLGGWAPAATTSTSSTSTTSSTTSSTTAAEGQTPTVTSAAVIAPPPATDAPATQPPAGTQPAQPAGAGDGSAGADDGGTPTTAAASAPLASEEATGQAGNQAGSQTGGQPASAAAVAAATSAAPSVAPIGAATAAPTTAPPPVVNQVLPEVVRLVSTASTPTTSRVTLQLAPEALGEVRVVLSVRDGAVQVSLAAGQEAQRALIEGSPELRRLLETAGASDPRIVVRDLPATPQTTPTTTAGTSGQPGAHADLPQSGDQAGSGWDGRGDQHAGTRGGNHAKDGTQDGPLPGGRPIDPVTGAHAGIDVTV